MSRGFKVKSGPFYYYLEDRNGGVTEGWSYLIYDMGRWDLLELWWVVFWAWLKG